jgi:hypothetical protein
MLDVYQNSTQLINDAVNQSSISEILSYQNLTTTKTLNDILIAASTTS